jgi:DNA polymerase-1
MNRKIFFLDAYALIFRSYYAFIRNPRITTSGLNTSAIFGFLTSLLDVIQKEKPGHIAVVFDPPGPNFRHEMYTAYKANREATPEDIKKSVPYIKKLVEGLNIPVFEIPGFEADDVIGTLAITAQRQGYEVYMMTPDKDFAQLVMPGISMYKPSRSGSGVEIWGEAEVCRNFGIEKPAQVIDMLALWGDASDNIPGAPGIGEKTAAKLIAEFGSAEGVLHNTAALKGKIQESLQNNVEQVLLSKKLATIKTDVPLNFDVAQLQRKPGNIPALQNLIQELEFRSSADRILRIASMPAEESLLPGEVVTTTAEPVSLPEPEPVVQFKRLADVPHEYLSVTNAEGRKELIARLAASRSFCFDSETTGLSPLLDDIVGLSFCLEAGKAYYVPFPTNRDEALIVAAEFREVFENPDIEKTGQNIKFDMLALSAYNIFVQGPLFDTMVAHYLLEPEVRHNLDALAQKYLAYLPIPIEALIGKKNSGLLSMRLTDPVLLRDYACEDADVTWQVRLKLEPLLEKEGQMKLFREIEMPLVRVLFAMERAGVFVDTKVLRASGEKLKAEMAAVEKTIFGYTQTPINLNSPRQLGELLFEKLKIATDVKMTKTKQYSTGEEELVKYIDKHPVVKEILEYRGLQKLLSTYVDALPQLVSPRTRRIHTSFNQAVTSTGRLSSTNPNLQNIPVRDERGRDIRKAFCIQHPGNVFFSADYSQIELRLMAHFSNDPSLIDAFRNNEDIHTATAAKVFKVDKQEVTREMRSKAKVANFGIIYGISAFGLSQRMFIPRTEAKTIIDCYFESYPGVKQYMDDCIRRARDEGFVATLFGRKRYLPDINSRNATVRGMAERNAINAPIQGTAADIIKIAMVRIAAALESEKMKSRLILQVHDELDFEAVLEEVESLKAIVVKEMSEAASLLVPLVVDTGAGPNWAEAH